MVKADVGGCRAKERRQVTVRNWLGIDDLDKYEEYVIRWHALIKEISDFMMKPAAPGVKGKVHELFLKHFHENPYDLTKVFFPQVYDRIDEWRRSSEYAGFQL